MSVPALLCKDFSTNNVMVRSSSRKESAAKAAVAALTLLLALGFGLFATAQEKPLAKNEHVAREGGEREEKDTARKRIEWFYQQRAFPLGFIPAGARLRALQELDHMLEREGKLVRQPEGSVQQFIQPVTTMWTPIGPQPTVATIFGNTSGRVTALAVDPTNSNIVYLGGAEGGVWKSMNGGTNWTSLTDSQQSLAVGSIVIDPNNPNTIYVGTGEENFAIDSYYGAGILKSTDGGATWTQLGSGTFFNAGGAPVSARSGGARIGALAISPNSQILLAAVQGAGSVASGIYRSTNGGLTWSPAPVLGGAPGTEVVFHPTDNTIAYAALGSIFGSAANGVYKSTDGGATWNPVTNTGGVLPVGAATGRIEIAIAPSSPSTLYASIQDPRGATFGALLGFFKTTDGGANWITLPAPDYCSPQCWYDNVVRVDPNPTDPPTVFAAGSAVSFPTGGYLIRSIDGGNSWSEVAVGGNSVRLHVDHHALAFSKPGSGTLTLYAGNDGGVWSSAILGTPGAMIWSDLNNTLNITQFYPGHSIHPSDDQVGFGGTQDNGTQKYTGALGWADVTCGDGGWTAVDPQFPSTIYVTCQDIDIRKSVFNGDARTFSFADNGIDQTDNGAFIPPFVIDASTPQRLYFGTFRLWQTTDSATTWSAISGDLTGGGTLSTIAVAPGNSSVVYTGSSSGHVQVSTNVAAGSGTFNDVSIGLPTRAVTQISVDASDATGRTAYVTFSGFTFGTDAQGHVFKTINGGTVWTDISIAPFSTTPLPNTPVNDIAIDPDDPTHRTLYVATDVGVFQTTDGGVTWTTLSTGLPRVAVLSLKLRRESRTLRAATHGRGVWDLKLPNLAGTPSFNLSSIQPSTAAAGSAGFTLTLNGNGFTANSIVRWTIGTSTTTVTPTPPVNANQLTANITATLVGAAAAVQVTVSDPGQANPTNSLVFSVTGPAPTINPPLNPATATAGSGDTPLTLNGTNFISGSKVNWNGSPLPTTTVVSATQVTTTIPQALLAFGGVNTVTVVNPAPGGGPSNGADFTVNSLPPANDNFTNATALTSGSFSSTVDSFGATIEATDPVPTCAPGSANPPIKTVWYRFIAGGNGSVTADTIGSSYDTILTVWTGSPGNFTNVACNDDIDLGFNIQSRVIFNVTSGTTYFLMVSAFGSPPDPRSVGLGGRTVFNLTTSVPVGGDFAVSSPTGMQTVNAGQSASYTITVTPQNGFNAAVMFSPSSCSFSPAAIGTSCSFNPTSVTPGTTPGNSTMLTISTTARSLLPLGPSIRQWPRPVLAPWLAAIALALAAAMLAALQAKRRRLAAYLPLAALLVLLALHTVSCGGGGGTPPPMGTQAGTYTVTVTGTSGTTTHNATVTLKVN